MIRISVKKNVFVCLVIAIIIILSLYQYCDNNTETCFYLKQDIPRISGNYLQLNTSKVPSGHVRWLPTERMTTPTKDTLQKLLGRDGRKKTKQSGRKMSSDTELKRVERVDMEEVTIEEKQRELAKVYGLDLDHDNKSLGYGKEEFAKFEENFDRDDKRSSGSKGKYRNDLIGENKTVVRLERVDKTILDPSSISKHEQQEYSNNKGNGSSMFMYASLNKTELNDKYESINDTKSKQRITKLPSASKIRKTNTILASIRAKDESNRNTYSRQHKVINSNIEGWRNVVNSNDVSKSTKVNSIFALANGHHASNNSTVLKNLQVKTSERMTKDRYVNRDKTSLMKGHSFRHRYTSERFDNQRNATRNSNIYIDSKENYRKVDTSRTGNEENLPGNPQLQNIKLESTKILNDRWNESSALGEAESESGENDEFARQVERISLSTSDSQGDTEGNSNVDGNNLGNSQVTSGDDGEEVNSDEELTSSNSINKINEDEITDEVDENFGDKQQGSGNILEGNVTISKNVTTELQDVDNFEEDEENTIKNTERTENTDISLNRSTEEKLQTEEIVNSKKQTLFASKTRSNGRNDINQTDMETVNSRTITNVKVGAYHNETKCPNDAEFKETQTIEKPPNNRNMIKLKQSKSNGKDFMMGRQQDSGMTIPDKIITRRSNLSLENKKGNDVWNKSRKSRRKSRLLFFKNVTCESLDPKLVLYNRIFKTGSSSLNQYLLEEWKKHYFSIKIGTTEDWYKTGDSYPYPEVIEEFASRSSRRRVYSGHFYFRDNIKVERPYTYINQVRDPVERIISHYFYMRHSSDRPKHRIAEMRKNGELNETLAECLERQHRGCESNMMTRFFCGNAEFCRTGSREAIERAKYNMLHRFAAIGLVDQLDLYLKILRKRLPHFFRIKRPLSRVKANNEKGYLEKVPPDVKTKLRKANFADYEIYKYAKKMFWKQVKVCSLDIEQNGERKVRTKEDSEKSSIVNKS